VTKEQPFPQALAGMAATFQNREPAPKLWLLGDRSRLSEDHFGAAKERVKLDITWSGGREGTETL